ncbi:MAG TPA: single-stranded-DNA-specific exonuclease RecJ, partial [Dehalococcoidia bacterium]|nr:single-stranded-DNA-specific exonuclease RecJ [Dehalococcoidia bacterium]
MMGAANSAGQRWRVLPEPPPGFLDGGPYPSIIRTLLYHRGVGSPAEAEAFLSPTLANGPLDLPEVDRALGRLKRALAESERIAVFGDFDVDGITSTALLVQGLERLGGAVLSYIPHRISEGYGLNESAIANIRDQGVTLL